MCKARLEPIDEPTEPQSTRRLIPLLPRRSYLEACWRSKRNLAEKGADKLLHQLVQLNDRHQLAVLIKQMEQILY